MTWRLDSTSIKKSESIFALAKDNMVVNNVTNCKCFYDWIDGYKQWEFSLSTKQRSVYVLSGKNVLISDMQPLIFMQGLRDLLITQKISLNTERILSVQ